MGSLSRRGEAIDIEGKWSSSIGFASKGELPSHSREIEMKLLASPSVNKNTKKVDVGCPFWDTTYSIETPIDEPSFQSVR